MGLKSHVCEVDRLLWRS